MGSVRYTQQSSPSHCNSRGKGVCVDAKLPRDRGSRPELLLQYAHLELIRVVIALGVELGLNWVRFPFISIAQ